jgi:hypothetical protein
MPRRIVLNVATLDLLKAAFDRTPHELGARQIAQHAALEYPIQAFECYRAIAVLDDVLDRVKGRK